jgi:hypothetical protein
MQTTTRLHVRQGSCSTVGTLVLVTLFWSLRGSIAPRSVRFAPYFEYRYAAFQGDDGTGDNRSFDPLFYGFNDWNQWYLRELVGEYVATNSNNSVHLLRLRAKPVEPVTLHLFYLFLRLKQITNEVTPRPPMNSRVALIENKTLSQEIDFIADRSAAEYLSFSGVAAVVVPSSGSKDFFGGSETWSGFMLYGSLKF